MILLLFYIYLVDLYKKREKGGLLGGLFKKYIKSIIETKVAMYTFSFLSKTIMKNKSPLSALRLFYKKSPPSIFYKLNNRKLNFL